MNAIKHNQKVYVVCENGIRRPARTIPKRLHIQLGCGPHCMPVWYVSVEGHRGWDHVVYTQLTDLVPR